MGDLFLRRMDEGLVSLTWDDSLDEATTLISNVAAFSWVLNCALLAFKEETK